MKKLAPLFLFLILGISSLRAQTKTYSTSSGELIFSFADYKINSAAVNTPVRFTCFFHVGGYQHVDFTNNVGLYSGLALRNVGFTSTSADSFNKVKRRQYTIGVPLAIKIGDLGNDTYLFAGGEAELAFHYKEKFFKDDVKQSQKDRAWFSARTNLFLPSVFVGVNFKGGANIKFKYYLEDFYNTNYTTTDGTKKYGNVNSSQMFYFSLSLNIRNASYKSGGSYNKGS
jgi:hypothetical protein